MQINAIFNANIYVNGNSLLGQASEIKLPDVEISQDEYKGLGLAGTIKLPSGVEALEGEITWNSFYENVFATVYHPFKAVQLMVRADIQKHDAQGLAAGSATGYNPDRHILQKPLGKLQTQRKGGVFQHFSSPRSASARGR